MRKKPIFWYFVVVIVLAIMGALVPWFGDEPLVTKVMWTIWGAIMGVLGYAFIQTNKDIFYYPEQKYTGPPVYKSGPDKDIKK